MVTAISTKCFSKTCAVPKENLVGPLNQGWKVAITTLMFERSGAGGRDHAAQIARLTELAKQFPTRQEPAWHESHIRQQLAQLAIDVKALQVTRLRGLTPPTARRAAGARRLDPQIVRIGAGAAHSRFLVDPARALRDRRRADRGGAGRRALAPPRARRAAIHDRRRHQRNPAQHHRRAGLGIAEGVSWQAVKWGDTSTRPPVKKRVARGWNKAVRHFERRGLALRNKGGG